MSAMQMSKEDFVAHVKDTQVTCAVPGCEFRFFSLTSHIQDVHGMTPGEYHHQYRGELITAPIVGHYMSRFGRSPQEGPIDQYLNNFKPLPQISDLILQNYKEEYLSEYILDPKYENLIPKEDPYYCFQDSPLRALIAGLMLQKNVFASGPTGCGKTQLYLQAFNRLGLPIDRANMNGEVTSQSFVGFRHIENGETIFKYGNLPRAMEGGYPLICDEIDFTPPSIASVLFPVMEGTSRSIYISETGETIYAKPGFAIYGTGNTGGKGDLFGHYTGTEVQSTALLDRFTYRIEMDYLNPKSEIEMLVNRFSNINPECIKCVIECASEIRKSFMMQDLNTPLSTRRIVDFFESLPILGINDSIIYNIMNWYPDESEKDLLNTLFDRLNLREILQKGIYNEK